MTITLMSLSVADGKLRWVYHVVIDGRVWVATVRRTRLTTLVESVTPKSNEAYSVPKNSELFLQIQTALVPLVNGSHHLEIDPLNEMDAPDDASESAGVDKGRLSLETKAFAQALVGVLEHVATERRQKAVRADSVERLMTQLGADGLYEATSIVYETVELYDRESSLMDLAKEKYIKTLTSKELVNDRQA